MALTLAQLIAQQRERIAALLAERQPHTDTLTELRDLTAAENDRDLTEAEATRARTARGERTRIDAQVNAFRQRLDMYEAEQRDQEAIETLSRQVGTVTAAGAAVSGAAAQIREHRIGGATVTNEPLTYSQHTARQGISFVTDLYHCQMRGAFGEVAERMGRHEREMRPVMEQRAVATTVAGSLVVPQYLPEMVALTIRAGRPFANSIVSANLPVQGMTITVPRITTGLATAVQASQNTAVQNTDTAVTDLTINVVTIAGQQDLSRQLIERGVAVDEVIFAELASAYAANLDLQTLTGSGSSGQMLGVQNTAGIGAATLFGAPPTVATVYSKIAGQIAGIAGLGAGVKPRIIVMHPRRWGWLTAQVDSSNRPLVVPLATGPYNATALNLSPGGFGGDAADVGDVARSFEVVGTIQGLPVITDANIPTAVGTESEDLIFVYDNTKHLLWENGDGSPEFLRFEQTLGNQLTVKLVGYGYAAFTAGRFPAVTGKIGGLDTGGATFGLVNPSF